MYFTSSWDDGHPSDLRLAELMQKHGFKASFFVPIINSEGLPVMQADELRFLAQGAEVGSHTHDHVYADSVPLTTWAAQVVAGKQALEQMLGRSVLGFCYPGGKRVPGAVDAVKSAGFAYARTTENLRFDAGFERFMLPTTLQFYPHTVLTLSKNFLKYRNYRLRAPIFRQALRYSKLQDQLRCLLEFSLKSHQVFHLWGHSWELDTMGLWSELDGFLKFAATCVPSASRVSNQELAAAALLERRA